MTGPERDPTDAAPTRRSTLRTGLAAVVTVALAGCAGRQSTAGGGDTNRSTTPVDTSPPWQYDAGEAVRDLSVDPASGVYVGTESALHALDGRGASRWTVADYRTGRPAFGGGTVYVPTGLDRGIASGPSGVAAVDALTGETRWTAELDVAPFRLLGADDAGVYAASHDDALGDIGEEGVALDATGDRRWTAETGDPLASLLYRGRLYVATTGLLYAFDTASGETRLRGAYADGDPVLARDGLVLTTNRQGLFALRTADHEVAWTVAAGREEELVPSDVVLGTAGSDRAYLGDWNGNVRAVDLAGGTVEWRYDASDGVVQGLTTGPRGAYFEAGPAAVALDDRGNRRWRFVPDGEAFVGGIAVVGDVTYLDRRRPGTDAATLVALDGTTGERRWSFASDDGIEWLTPFDDALLFADGGGTVYAVDGTKPNPDGN